MANCMLQYETSEPMAELWHQHRFLQSCGCSIIQGRPSIVQGKEGNDRFPLALRNVLGSNSHFFGEVDLAIPVIIVPH